MDGATRDDRVTDQAQFRGGVLDVEAVLAIAEADLSLQVARRMLMLAISEPEAGRGLVRAASKRAEVAASILTTWWERGLPAVSPTAPAGA